MAEAEPISFQVQFDVRLVPAEAAEAEVTGYASAGQVIIGGQTFGVYVGGFSTAFSAAHGIAQAGIAQHGIAQTGIAQTGIAQTGIAQHGISQTGIAR